MEHIAQGDLIALRAFKDNSTNTNLVNCGLISKVYSAFDEGVVLEVGLVGGNVVCTVAQLSNATCESDILFTSTHGILNVLIMVLSPI